MRLPAGSFVPPARRVRGQGSAPGFGRGKSAAWSKTDGNTLPLATYELLLEKPTFIFGQRCLGLVRGCSVKPRRNVMKRRFSRRSLVLLVGVSCLCAAAVSASAQASRGVALPPPRVALPPPGPALPPPSVALPPPSVALPPPSVALPPPGVALPPPGVALPPPGVALPPPTIVVPPPVFTPAPGIAQPPPSVALPPPALAPVR